jgi:hypothetical protein
MDYIIVATFLAVIGLYGYAIYGTIVITRILHEIVRNTRRN